MSERLTDSPERLRLGIDLDGVVADFNGGWIARYNRDFGARLHPDQVVGWDALHALTEFHSMIEFWDWARADGRSVFRDLPPLPGAIEALHELAREHRIAIITARFDWAIADTLAWLAEHRVLAREVHFLAAKQQVACDIYLDDAPYQLEALRRARPQATICRRVAAYNRPVAGGTDVQSWPEFRDVVASVAAGRPQGV
jgi:5'(3')-deoxyribonucleotidase